MNEERYLTYRGGFGNMIDGRLIDYARGYRDYDETLREEGECLSLCDMLTMVEGFVGKYPHPLITGGFDDGCEDGVGGYDRERAVVIYLKQALSIRGLRFSGCE